MNSVLLSLGVAIVVALFTALIAPFFIDWNAYKHVLEARLSEAVGQEVAIGEVVELRLLPTPVVKAAGLRVDALGAEAGAPVIAAPRIAARIALAPILRGEIEIDEIVIDEPRLQVQWRGDGTVGLPGFAAADSPIDPQRVSLEALEIRDGALTIRDEEMREVATLTGVHLTGEAGSLEGPFKAEGGAVADGVLYTFRLATGRMQSDGAIRTKLALQPASGDFELALDGRLTMAGAQPSFSGAARLQRVAAPVAEDVPAEYRAEQTGTPWRALMELEATPLAVAIDRLVLGIGPDERAVQFAGQGRIELHPKLRISADLQTRQIDLDRALGHGPGGRAAIAELARVASGLKTRIETLDAPLALRLRSDAALINGSLAEELDLAADIAGGTVTIEDLRVRLPGKSMLTGEGTITLGEAAPLLEADTQLETRQTGVLLEWLGAEDFRIGALKLRPGAAALVAKAKLRLSDDVLRLDDLEAQIDDSAIFGQVVYQTGEQGKLELAIAVDSLDLDRYFDIVPQAADEGGVEEEQPRGGPADIALRLDADILRLGDFEVRVLLADLAYSGGSLTVNSLSLGDLGGTSLAASGRIDDLFGKAEGELTASLNSEDLTGVARLAADFGFTGPDGADLVAQAAALSPAAVEAKLKATRSEDGTVAEVAFSAALGGTIARAQANFRGRLADARAATLDLLADANNPDSSRLLAQLGLPTGRDKAAEKQPGRLRLTVKGPLGEGANLGAAAAFLGVSARLDGTLTMADETGFAGRLELSSADIRTLLRRFDVPGKEGEAPLPAEISGTLHREGRRWRLEGIDGQTGRDTFGGDMALELPEGGPRQLDGELDLDALDASWLLALTLGGESSNGEPGTWSEEPFDLAAMRLFEGRIGIGADRLELPGGASAGGARFDLVLGPERIAFSDLEARLFGGTATADLRLAGSELERGATLTADFALKDAAVSAIAWAPNGTPVATGTVDLAANVSGSGRSWLGLVSSLEGDGTFAARDGVLRGLDPKAFLQVVRAADSGMELTQDRVETAFQAYLASGTLSYDRFEGAFDVSDGIVSAKNMALETEEAGVQVSTLVDLHALSIDSEWTLTPNAAIDMVAAPPATVVFSGPISAPVQQVDVNALTGYLTVRRIEEDVRRLETAQEDALERQRLDRLLVRQTQEHMRRVREAREQARMEAERQEAERVARENAAEAAREEAARRQAERERAARLEAIRQEAEQAARESAAEAARQEAARREAERAAQEEAVGQDTRSIPREIQTDDTATGSTAPPAAGEQPPQDRTLEELVEEALRETAPPEAPPEPVDLTPPQAERAPVRRPRPARRPAAPTWTTEPLSGNIEIPYDPVDPGG